ncbi:MAG: hypothetical protein M1156_00070 [Candidatus Marsarchaeota archaeon]|nr:hypothetical protein [Candidatus Marsarchaeota archaeon]
MQKQNLNLGLILAGLPGTGKSFAAMGILRQSFIGEKPMSIVISPTEEWNGFGKTAGMEVVRIYDHNVRLNFLKCEDGVNKEKFYENLAMLMASASGAGPYREPMEKCLLAAFRRVYSLCTDPDPLYVYEEIENAVIDRHAKRTAAGVKYTKHGENIMAGLENLRQMLFKPQFAYQGGMNFRQLLEKGVVFDLSPVSNTMKPFFYALILNQAYGFADTFDVHGDQSLRMFICIEEAQLIFDNEEQSAANRDLKQRIQDFRKRGVCLAMLTHSANDIEISIRRLCQTKLYFRQSTESARYAAADLLFGQDVNDDIIDSLKKLRQQTCIASYMTIKNGSKEPSSSVFIRPLLVNISDAYKPDEIKAYAAPATGIRILSREGVGLHNTIEVFYAGEKIYKGVPDSEGRVCIEGLLKDKRYKVAMYGAKKKDTRFFDAYGGTDNVITVDIGSD